MFNNVILKEVQIVSGRLKNPYFALGERILPLHCVQAQNDIETLLNNLVVGFDF